MSQDNQITEVSAEDKKLQAVRPRRPRLQFSLATLMLLFTMATLIIAFWATARKLEEATADLKKYRSQLGYLEVSDRNKVHAVRVRTPGSLKWQWWVYLPKDRRFRLHLVTDHIPQFGIPAGGSGATVTGLPPGETLLYASVVKDRQGRWTLEVDPWVSTSIPQHLNPWVENSATFEYATISSDHTESVDPGKPMVLLRFRVYEPVGGGASRAPSTPCDGLMIWIEEDNPSKTPQTPSTPR